MAASAWGAGADVVEIADGLHDPIYCTAPPGDYKRLFIVERAGTIQILNLRTQSIEDGPFLDITDLVSDRLERGLLGLAFHPEFVSNGYFFVYYSSSTDESVVARYSVDARDPDRADPDSAQSILTVEDANTFHQGGQIAFGPLDGHLYIALGDNGWPDYSQLLDILRGKILRIDVDDFAADTYTIPADNPYADPNDDALDEIWARGLRNPYRFSFDRETGDLYLGDVGGWYYEEIDVQPGDSAGGENYGWPCFEGFECDTTPECGCGGCLCIDCSCSKDDYVEPIVAYSHEEGRCAVIAGCVYRGSAMKSLLGSYIYSDWCSEEVFSLVYDGSGVIEEKELTSELAGICAVEGWGEDAYGEIYAASGYCDSIFKLIPADLGDRDCNENLIADHAELAAGEEVDCDGSGVPDSCEIEADPSLDANRDGVIDGCSPEIVGSFIRGDANGDGQLGIGDAVHVLHHLFSAGDAQCQAAMDLSDDGQLGLADPIRLLSYLFMSGDPPPAPFPDCGVDTGDPSGSTLDCDRFDPCFSSG